MKTGGAGSTRRLWRGRRTARRGGAVVEMAVVSPLLLTMLAGIMEFGYVFMVEQTLTNGVREAARLATLPGTTDAEIRTRFQEAVASVGLNITNDMLTIQPATAENPVVKVSVSVPYADVSLLGILPSSMFSFSNQGCGDDPSSGGGVGEKQIGSSCSMRKEGAT